MRAARAAFGLVFIAACSAPPPPTYPGRETIGPPLPASATCVPPFPMNFAQDWFVFADLDQGISCEVFVERDECAVGIFHDCTDTTAKPREWQGRLLDRDDGAPYAPGLDLAIAADDDMMGGQLARSPVCCAGDLYPRGESVVPTRGLLTCNDGPCITTPDRRHTGFFLESRIDFDPGTLEAGEVTLSEGEETPDAVFANGALWAVSGSSLFVYTPATSNKVETAISVTGTTMLRASSDQTAVYLIGQDVIRIDTNGQSETARRTLAGRATASAVTSEGLLVAYDDGDQSAVVSLDLITLMPRAAPSPAGRRVTGLAPMDRPTALAVATAENMPSLYVVTATPALSLTPIVNFSTVRGMALGEIVPYNPILIDGDTAGLLAACYEGAPSQHCYFEVDVVSGAVERIGLPNVMDLLDVAYDLVQNRLVFTSVNGTIMFVDRGPAFWPRIQEQIRIETHRLGAVAVDPTQARAYVLQELRGVVSVVAQPQ